MKIAVVLFATVLATSCVSDGTPTKGSEVISSEVAKDETKKSEEKDLKVEVVSKKEVKVEEKTETNVVATNLEKEVQKAQETAEANVAPIKAKEAPVAVKAIETLYVTSSLLNVRSGPGMQFPAIKTLSFASSVQSNLGKENKIWLKLAEGQFVSSRFLASVKPTAAVDPAPAANVNEAAPSATKAEPTTNEQKVVPASSDEAKPTAKASGQTNSEQS